MLERTVDSLRDDSHSDSSPRPEVAEKLRPLRDTSHQETFKVPV